MKKKNLITLKLRKNKISNLNLLNHLIGGIISEACPDTQSETNPGDIETMYCGETESCETDCGGCNTNDTTRSVQAPSLQAVCNNFGISGNC